MATATYNGKTYTRKTDRTYTHAVGCTHAVVQPWHRGEADGIVAWCGSAALAAKAAKKYSAAQWGFSRVQVVEVQQ
jgi:hypothetical protein